MIFASRATLVSLSLLASQVAAHGYVEWVFANDRNYTGDNVDDPHGIPTLIRTVSGRGPVTDVTSQYIACGTQAKVVSEEALVDAGGTIEIRWSPSWPHNTGSMTAWMAECGGIDCTKFEDLSQAQWFKVDEKGVDPETGQWYLGEIFQHPGMPYNLTIPNIKSGHYLLRHELINLALVATPGGSGAELYPQCIQLSVQGSGDLVPQSSDYVHFPGAYKATDPGLTFAPGDQPKSQYEIPGGPLAKLVPASTQSPETDTTNVASSTSLSTALSSTSTAYDGQTSAATTTHTPSTSDASPTETSSADTTSKPTDGCSVESMKKRGAVALSEVRGRTLRGRRVRV
ncbi:hypothetical protein V8D89_006187 [Ganoderma adspersum]